MSAKFSKLDWQVNAINKVSIGLIDVISKFIGRNPDSVGKETGKISIVGKSEPISYFLNTISLEMQSRDLQSGKYIRSREVVR